MYIWLRRKQGGNKSFFRYILQDYINYIELNNQTITEKKLMDDKVGIMDIKAVLNENIQCDVEMQVVNKHNIENKYKSQ